MSKPRTTANTRPERLQLHDRGDGGYEAVYAAHVFRFLLDNGQTVDVHAHRDDSDLRMAVCDETGASIVGVATLPAPEVADAEG